MLIAGIAIWLVLVAFFVALCRGAASADGRNLIWSDGYPTASAAASRASAPGDFAGLVLLEDRRGDPPGPAAQDLRGARARAGRGRAGQYAAGS
jgi:hypothetical protein